MNAPRLTTTRLRQLADQLPDHYTTLLAHLSRARVLTGAQLDRLLWQPDTANTTAQRARQRAMTRLCQLGLAATLQRRIGGVRAGSAGHVHVLTPAGHKLLALLNSQQPPRRIRHSRAPGPMFLTHALAIAEIYVQLTERSRDGSFWVTTFITEPATWWPTATGNYLRPDAYTLLATPTHRDCWWLEIDRNTESIPRLRDKLHNYLDHATHNATGPHDALPGVLFTAPDEQRANTIHATIAAIPEPDAELFAVCRHSEAANRLITALHAQ